MNEPRIPAGTSLVYTRYGRVAHISYPGLDDTFCRISSRMPGRGWVWRPTLFGTGTQDEWEKARLLPLCKRCFPRGPRRPLELSPADEDAVAELLGMGVQQ